MNAIRSFFNLLMLPFRAFARFVSPRRLLGLAMPARSALLTGIALLLAATAAFLIWYSHQDKSSLDSLRIGKLIGGFSIFILTIPLTLFFFLKFWIEGMRSPFPDIDDAWQQGLRTLRRNHLDLSQLPIFLVLGSPDDRSTRQLMQAASLNLIVDGVPEGRQPITWYADDRACYLVLTNVGCLAKLNQLASAHPQGMPGGNQAPAQRPSSIKGTLVSEGFLESSGPAANIQSSDPFPPPLSGGIKGTMVPPATQTLSPGGTLENLTSGAISVGHSTTLEESARLEHICMLLKRERHTLCPINGILTLLPYEVVQNVVAANELPSMIKKDLMTVRDTCQLSAPITALVTGMEQERGFSELVNRVGMARAKAHRFGKGFNVWNTTTGENVDALSSHACGAFEDWVYSLFREENGLNKPGNERLFTLLCNIRSHIHARLRNILVHSYSQEHSEPMLFSGCYFAATGETPDNQAFVRNVFEKMVELEEDLEWTPTALQTDTHYHRWAQLGVVLNLALLLGILGLWAFNTFSE